MTKVGGACPATLPRCSLSKAGSAAVQQASAAARLPAQARRRITWDSQLRLHIFWLTVTLCSLGECALLHQESQRQQVPGDLEINPLHLMDL